MKDKHLSNDRQHFAACHQRWMEKRNRKQEDHNYRDEWYSEQCGRCVFYIPITGVFFLDYGACSNEASPFDKTIMFEHDGCTEFKDTDEWVE